MKINPTTSRFPRTSRDRRPISEPEQFDAGEIALYIVCAIAIVVLAALYFHRI
jgi:hypothetical protein